MKVWGAIVLVCSISYVHADRGDSVSEEDKYGSSLSTEKSLGGKKGAGHSSGAKERNVNFTASSSSSPDDDMEELSAFSLTSVDDQTAPPGGGIPLDEKFLDAIAPLPDIETPWWQHWWAVISGWFSGRKS